MTLADANLENSHWINNSTINCEPQTDSVGLVTYVIMVTISFTFCLGRSIRFSSNELQNTVLQVTVYPLATTTRMPYRTRNSIIISRIPTSPQQDDPDALHHHTHGHY